MAAIDSRRLHLSQVTQLRKRKSIRFQRDLRLRNPFQDRAYPPGSQRGRVAISPDPEDVQAAFVIFEDNVRLNNLRADPFLKNTRRCPALASVKKLQCNGGDGGLSSSFFGPCEGNGRSFYSY